MGLVIMYETEQDARNAAIGLLARREHSRKELYTKLSGRCEQINLDTVLDDLERNGYLSDQRFTESFIRMRTAQGHGEVRIRFDLRQKGVAAEMISSVLDESGIDWYEQAADVYSRKFRTAVGEKDYKERSKRMRYLAQRGFNMDQINYAISHSESDQD